MRVRGTGRGMKTLSRFALIGVIGSGAAACSSDASRLGDPFGNPFASSSSEPAATGSLPEEGPSAPIRTGRVESEALASPGMRMSPRPTATAPLSPSTRVASAEPMAPVSGGMVSGLNPDAGRTATRPAPPPMSLSPKAAEKVVDKAAEKRAAEAARKAAEVERLAEAKRLVEANRLADEKKLAEARKIVADRKLAEATAARKAAETKAETAKEVAKDAAKDAAAKKHVRPGQAVAKVEPKDAKSETKTDKTVRKIEIKAEPKVEAKSDSGKSDPAKSDPAKAKAEAARKSAEAEAKLARAEAAKDAARKAAEAKTASAEAKTAAAEAKTAAADAKAAEAAAKATPVKVAAVAPAEPATTASVAPAASDQSFRWPAKGRVITGYGSSGNEGINIAVPEGTPVKAAEDGTVAYAGSDVKGYGKLVLVRHSNGYVSAYAHNGELDVRPGEKVKRGQTIAKSGATGNVTSPQLHFEIRKGATPVDPMPHLASN
ncbi:peptidase M23 [Methylobacterium sp. Leaf399]|nr:peptidase M23 [Methylobacterium sp. Leaf108]KQT15153.1 peptidase M23 [Methylobacterium sp. Leaf399]